MSTKFLSIPILEEYTETAVVLYLRLPESVVGVVDLQRLVTPVPVTAQRFS
jgi:hypothetical protein